MARSINFFTEDLKFRLDHKRGIRSWISGTILQAKSDYTEINFIFCSDKYLLKINRDYLKHDYYTDIITFSSGTLKSIAGDIFISVDRVKENASLFKVPFKSELNRVMIHGILHLLGYKDKRKADASRMRRMENKILSLRTF